MTETINQLIETSGLALLVAVVSLFYAYRALALKDVEGLRKRYSKPVKDRDGYAREVGWLMLAFAAASLVMAVLLMFSYPAAVIEGLVTIVAACVIWDRINKKYES